MRYIFGLLLVLNVLIVSAFAVDATLKIEKDVEERLRIAIVDGSASQSDRVFNLFYSDLKISGHFLPDDTHHIGELNSNILVPGFSTFFGSLTL